jgi:hypothetical protein
LATGKEPDLVSGREPLGTVILSLPSLPNFQRIPAVSTPPAISSWVRVPEKSPSIMASTAFSGDWVHEVMRLPAHNRIRIK